MVRNVNKKERKRKRKSVCVRARARPPSHSLAVSRNTFINGSSSHPVVKYR